MSPITVLMPERAYFKPSVAPPVQRLVLPVPPSANRYWRFDRGTIHIAKDGVSYKREVEEIAARASLVQLEGDVVVRLVWYRARRAGDLDNRLKQCLDALQGVFFANDAQIAELRFRRCEDPARPRLEVLVARAGTSEARQILSLEMGGAW